MTKKLFFICFFCVTVSWGQTKFLSLKQHNIILNIPKNWVKSPNEKLPFYVVPFKKKLDDITFMYLYIYNTENTSPNLNLWIDNNINILKEKNKGVKIDTLFHKFDNLSKDKYLTGNYRIFTYEYQDERKEAQLVIETKKTFITVLLSAENKSVFRKQYRSFKRMIKSMKISYGRSVM
jgi:hypothetical protein